MKTVFYTKKERVIVDYTRLEEKEFATLLQKEKPKEVFHNFYSKENPCWAITDYLEENRIKYYATSWANKTPIIVELTKFYRYLSNQGLTEVYFENDKQ
jgi:hypothetical protein